MNSLLFAAMLFAVTAPAEVAQSAEVDVLISIGHPGFYGRLDVSGYPPPRVLYRRPMVIEHDATNRPPIYMRVPPGHAKDWQNHCRAYNACGEQVYFVQDNWYNHEYVPRYQERHGNRRDERGEGHREGGKNDQHDRNR